MSGRTRTAVVMVAAAVLMAGLYFSLQLVLDAFVYDEQVAWPPADLGARAFAALFFGVVMSVLAPLFDRRGQRLARDSEARDTPSSDRPG